MKESLLLAWDALFLKPAAYASLHDAEKPFISGLKLLLIISLLVGVAGAIGGLLAWGTNPSAEDVREIVLETIKQQDWYTEQLKAQPKFDAIFEEQFGAIFSGIAQFTLPTIGASLLTLITTPLMALVIWLVWGVLGHLSGRIFGGDANIKQTLGMTALAIAPTMVNLTTLIPGISVGMLVFVWTMICRYQAIKTGHHLTWGRALTATLLPYVVLALLLGVIIGVGVAIAIQAVTS